MVYVGFHPVGFTANVSKYPSSEELVTSCPLRTGFAAKRYGTRVNGRFVFIGLALSSRQIAATVRSKTTASLKNICRVYANLVDPNPIVRNGTHKGLDTHTYIGELSIAIVNGNCNNSSAHSHGVRVASCTQVIDGHVRFPRPTPWRRSMGFRVEWILCVHFARLLFFFCFYNPFVPCSHTSPRPPPRPVCRTKPRPLEPTRFSRSLANGEISSKQQPRNRYDNRVSYGRIEKSRVRPLPSQNFNVFLIVFARFSTYFGCVRGKTATFNRFLIGRLTENNPCTRAQTMRSDGETFFPTITTKRRTVRVKF